MLRVILATLILATIVIVGNITLAGDEVACQLQAGLATAALKISSGGKTIWEGQVPKGGQTTVRVPKGAFNVEARFFDEHMKKTQTLSRPLDTRTCSRFPIDVTMPEGG